MKTIPTWVFLDVWPESSWLNVTYGLVSYRMLLSRALRGRTFDFWGANNVDDSSKCLLLQCSPAGLEQVNGTLGLRYRHSSNQSHFAGGLEATRALITAMSARENLKTWSLGRWLGCFPSRLGILTEAAGEGCSSLPHYLTGCVGAKPEGASERGGTRKKHCGHVYSLHNQLHTDSSLFCKY